MNTADYARRLLQYRGKPLSLLSAMGVPWLIMEFVLLLLAAGLFVLPGRLAQSIGLLFLGYVFGALVADVRSCVIASRKWQLQQKLYDWPTIEALAEGRPREPGTGA